LRKENPCKAKRKNCRLQRIAKISRDARAESIGQRGEEEVERVSEFKQLWISDTPNEQSFLNMQHTILNQSSDFVFRVFNRKSSIRKITKNIPAK